MSSIEGLGAGLTAVDSAKKGGEQTLSDEQIKEISLELFRQIGSKTTCESDIQSFFATLGEHKTVIEEQVACLYFKSYRGRSDEYIPRLKALTQALPREVLDQYPIEQRFLFIDHVMEALDRVGEKPLLSEPFFHAWMAILPKIIPIDDIDLSNFREFAQQQDLQSLQPLSEILAALSKGDSPPSTNQAFKIVYRLSSYCNTKELEQIASLPPSLLAYLDCSFEANYFGGDDQRSNFEVFVSVLKRSEASLLEPLFDVCQQLFKRDDWHKLSRGSDYFSEMVRLPTSDIEPFTKFMQMTTKLRRPGALILHWDSYCKLPEEHRDSMVQWCTDIGLKTWDEIFTFSRYMLQIQDPVLVEQFKEMVATESLQQMSGSELASRLFSHVHKEAVSEDLKLHPLGVMMFNCCRLPYEEAKQVVTNIAKIDKTIQICPSLVIHTHFGAVIEVFSHAISQVSHEVNKNHILDLLSRASSTSVLTLSNYMRGCADKELASNIWGELVNCATIFCTPKEWFLDLAFEHIDRFIAQGMNHAQVLERLKAYHTVLKVYQESPYGSEIQPVDRHFHPLSKPKNALRSHVFYQLLCLNGSQSWREDVSAALNQPADVLIGALGVGDTLAVELGCEVSLDTTSGPTSHLMATLSTEAGTILQVKGGDDVYIPRRLESMKGKRGIVARAMRSLYETQLATHFDVDALKVLNRLAKELLESCLQHGSEQRFEKWCSALSELTLSHQFLSLLSIKPALQSSKKSESIEALATKAPFVFLRQEQLELLSLRMDRFSSEEIPSQAATIIRSFDRTHPLFDCLKRNEARGGYYDEHHTMIGYERLESVALNRYLAGELTDEEISSLLMITSVRLDSKAEVIFSVDDPCTREYVIDGCATHHDLASHGYAFQKTQFKNSKEAGDMLWHHLQMAAATLSPIQSVMIKFKVDSSSEWSPTFSQVAYFASSSPMVPTPALLDAWNQTFYGEDCVKTKGPFGYTLKLEDWQAPHHRPISAPFVGAFYPDVHEIKTESPLYVLHHDMIHLDLQSLVCTKVREQVMSLAHYLRLERESLDQSDPKRKLLLKLFVLLTDITSQSLGSVRSKDPKFWSAEHYEKDKEAALNPLRQAAEKLGLLDSFNAWVEGYIKENSEMSWTS